MSTIFSPIYVNKLELSNRLVMPPMATAKSGEQDEVTEAMCMYYKERAKYSKIGLIITEHSYIHKSGKAHDGQASIADDDKIPGLRKLTEAIHEEGVKVYAQISHAGSAATRKCTGFAPLAPSAVCHPRQKDNIPEEMTPAQIQDLVNWFAQAAVRAKAAGFDGVEIHSAHGYLLNQFYSPLCNLRTDAYGGKTVEERVRVHKEVIQAVRQAVGEEYPLAIRLGGCDYEPEGSTVDDCVEACRLFESYGVDLIDLSGGVRGYVRPGHTEPGYFRDMSIPVKKAVKLPVLVTGGVKSLEQADSLVEEGCADLIGVGRAIFKDPHWADEKPVLS